LRNEPELAEVLNGLREQRNVRASWFTSLEPDMMTQARLVQSVRKGILKQQFQSRQSNVFRYVTAAAACVVLGFVVGWGIRDQNTSAPSVGAGSNPALSGTMISSNPLNPNVGTATPTGRGQFHVTLYDRLGRAVAVQRFDTHQQARQFTEDFAQWQRAQQQMRNPAPVLREQF